MIRILLTAALLCSAPAYAGKLTGPEAATWYKLHYAFTPEIMDNTIKEVIDLTTALVDDGRKLDGYPLNRMIDFDGLLAKDILFEEDKFTWQPNLASPKHKFPAISVLNQICKRYPNFGWSVDDKGILRIGPGARPETIISEGEARAWIQLNALQKADYQDVQIKDVIDALSYLTPKIDGVGLNIVVNWESFEFADLSPEDRLIVSLEKVSALTVIEEIAKKRDGKIDVDVDPFDGTVRLTYISPDKKKK